MKPLTLLVLLVLTTISCVLADDSALKLELSRQLQQNLARSPAPFQAASTVVKQLAALSIAVQTQEKLDAIERTVAPKLKVGECGLIRIDTWTNKLSGAMSVGEPIEYGISSKPVNLLVQKTVEYQMQGVIKAGPGIGPEWQFDAERSFFLCYTKNEQGVFRRGLVSYAAAMNQINDKGLDLVRSAYREYAMKTRPQNGKSWRCNFRSHNHATPSLCAHPEMGGRWTSSPAQPE